MSRKSNKVSIQAKRRLFFSRPICFFLVCFSIITLLYNTFEIYQLNNEKKLKDEEYIKLQEEYDYLKNEIIKLNDSEYIANYARENYGYSKDGELIIKIDKTQEEKKVTVNEVNNADTPFKMGGVIIGILLFIYIFIKFIAKKRHSVN